MLSNAELIYHSMRRSTLRSKGLLRVCEMITCMAETPSTRHPAVVRAGSTSMPRLPMYSAHSKKCYTTALSLLTHRMIV